MRYRRYYEDRVLFRRFSEELYDFGNEVRTLIRETVERHGREQITDPDQRTIQLWACCLGALMFDISGSVLLLLSHGHHRAPAILNRSLYEYQVRLRYYKTKPEKGRLALKQMPERFKRILRADPTRSEHITVADRATFDAWLSERERIERENFKEEVLKTVVGADSYETVYDGYYGKICGHVHGYETIIRDVFHEYYNGVENHKIDYNGQIFDLNDHAAVCIHNLLYGLNAISGNATEKKDFQSVESRFDEIQARAGIDPSTWIGATA